MKKVVALMTMNNSMDSTTFDVFIEKFLAPQLWSGAVVVMDNLPAHKLASIEPMIGEHPNFANRYSRLHINEVQ
jgi:hypothetical protein